MKQQNNHEAGGQGPRHLTPQQQLWELIGGCRRKTIGNMLGRLKNHVQEDLCYALVAYLRFRIKRRFSCPFMQTLFISLLDVICSPPQSPQGGRTGSQRPPSVPPRGEDRKSKAPLSPPKGWRTGS